MEMLFMTPPPTHFVYIPAILLVGSILGFIIGRQAGIKEGQSRFLAGEGTHEDDDLL